MTATTELTKKQAIVDSALGLFVEQGFQATSTASIARAAGVATGTLFHHFPNKNALLEHLFITIKQEFATAMTSAIKPEMSIEQQAKHLWLAAIEWALTQSDKQLFLQCYSMSPALALSVRHNVMHDTLGFMSELLEAGQAQGQIAMHPLPILLEHCHGQYIAATRYFIEHPQDWQQPQYRAASEAIFWQSIAAG
ncbi:TetR/AcrR family transcriptional regulator [Shewanella sp. NIFS-20-20]|uniref:TetR/AcrR family transcriptional regulator n=1 Tax=Shewanella sp. NIFS-20-20 TaxID=2853806 RepID=UPI001C48368D|nr:TetR/AcrR family transcriptional regulator [Shewanella sp. NIFS-20-20]MBV7316494.1 TetR/AcrR family transcriptional regulator [Shewanella sp. NIFS-20-20]